MAKSIKAGVILIFLSLFILVVIAAPKMPTEFCYTALITSGEFFQEIRHYQSDNRVRQVVRSMDFQPSVTIIRPDLSVIWIFDEGATEYSESPYDPKLTPEIFSFDLPDSSVIKRKTMGREKILGYDTIKTRLTDLTVPEWEAFIWNASQLGGLTLKKMEQVINDGEVIFKLSVEITEIEVKPIPKEYFELPEGMTLVEDGLQPKTDIWENEFLPELHY